jgi:hypothetical protein
MTTRVDARVTAAVRGGGVTKLDARGLMPLERARATLALCASSSSSAWRPPCGTDYPVP